MPNLENAFKTVCELVKDFKGNEHRYRSPHYQEAEVRRDFIDKLFEALGWDVYHRTQKNPYEQEVKVEKGVSIGKAQKRADYAFYINPEYRQPKFFAEAKKPSRSLKNADDYFQTIRYGWNSNTPIAVLTDFEEFHVLDCRFKPNLKTVLDNPNHKSYRYADYTNKEIFKEIYYLFSRDDVEKNSLEKYSESFPKGKGKGKTAFKSVIKTIDDDFLEYIDEVRETLAKAFKKNDANLSSEELTEATQRTIDRIVFIRFLEDKLIEPEYYISEFGKKGNAWNEFISVCRKLDAKYNGIVFKKHFIDEQNFQGPEQNTFKKICDEMSYLNSPYDFNAIPIHILGSIYERFLGKVVNATAQRVKVEEKPEVRKAGGVYYTPKYIVDYIVDNTVGKILNNCHSSESWNPDDGNDLPRWRGTKGVEEGKTPSEISKLRFADIACGSGSFLIGVFETLLKYHTEYYQLHPEQAKKDGCINKDGLWILSIKQKQNILINNIYGVDIDNQAVEVTQLSLALKMLEDETGGTANDMQNMFHEKILPDLSKNIICGNSLIGTDILQGKMFPTEEERKLNPMDFEIMFPEVIIQGGFDAIVGNPPYVNAIQLKELFGESTKHYLKENYTTTKGTYDLYIPFIERALKFTKLKGYMSFITPNKFLSAPYGKEFRSFIVSKYTVVEISDLSTIKVFDKPSVYPLISIFQCCQSLKPYSIIVKKYINQIEYSEKYVSSKLLNLFPENIWGVLLSDDISIVEKCFNCSANLENVAEVWATSTAAEADEFSKYIYDNNQSYHKIINTGTIDRYSTSYGVEYFSNQRTKVLRPTIDLEKVNLRRRVFYKNKKIIFAKIALRIEAFLDDKGEYASINTNCVFDLKEEFSIKYLLAVVNSKLISYVYSQLFSGLRMSGGYYQFQAPQLRIIPIRKVNFHDELEKQTHDKIISLVDQMIESKKQHQSSKTDKDKTYWERKCEQLDNAIDSEVYKLYALTDEEIKIVEGKG